MKLVLCDKELERAFKNYAFTNSEKCIEKIEDWLSTKNFDESVFVCFAGWGGLQNEDLRNEHNSFLVSHSYDDITNFVDEYLEYKLPKNIDFFIYEFNTYQDAFSYCIDLQESF
jgi:hypothetical protein